MRDIGSGRGDEETMRGHNEQLAQGDRRREAENLKEKGEQSRRDYEKQKERRKFLFFSASPFSRKKERERQTEKN